MLSKNFIRALDRFPRKKLLDRESSGDYFRRGNSLLFLKLLSITIIARNNRETDLREIFKFFKPRRLFERKILRGEKHSPERYFFFEKEKERKNDLSKFNPRKTETRLWDVSEGQKSKCKNKKKRTVDGFFPERFFLFFHCADCAKVPVAWQWRRACSWKRTSYPAVCSELSKRGARLHSLRQTGASRERHFAVFLPPPTPLEMTRRCVCTSRRGWREQAAITPRVQPPAGCSTPFPRASCALKRSWNLDSSRFRSFMKKQ